GRIDQLDRAFLVHRLKVIQRLLGAGLVTVDGDEDLNRVFAHFRPPISVCVSNAVEERGPRSPLTTSSVARSIPHGAGNSERPGPWSQPGDSSSIGRDAAHPQRRLKFPANAPQGAAHGPPAG